MPTKIKSISIAGAGNVAWHLASGLKTQGFKISGIWSRTTSRAEELAMKVDAEVCAGLEGLKNNSDLILIAVSDKFIGGVASGISGFSGLVAHTAGSVNMQVLARQFQNYGVLYPLQTFSKDIPVNLKEIPFFVESNSPEGLSALKEIASGLSPTVYEADSEQRMMLHVAAVFAGNYSNLMYSIGNDLLRSCGLPVEALHPLIAETARKAIWGNPALLQTGPARRGDLPVIQKHLETLATHQEYSDIYHLLANTIIEKYK